MRLCCTIITHFHIFVFSHFHIFIFSHFHIFKFSQASLFWRRALTKRCLLTLKMSWLYIEYHIHICTISWLYIEYYDWWLCTISWLYIEYHKYAQYPDFTLNISNEDGNCIVLNTGPRRRNGSALFQCCSLRNIELYDLFWYS